MIPQLQAKLSDAFVLNHYVSIYVPSTVDGDKPAPQELIDTTLNHVELTLSTLFGGETESDGNGGWPDTRDGHLVKEQVKIVKAFCTEDDLLAKFDAVVAEVDYVKTAMTQQAVSLEIDGELAIR